MIVVDSSALIAVLFEEPEKQTFQDIIDGDERCVLSAVNAHETACILRARHGLLAVAEFWQWLTDNKVEIVPFDEVQVHAAAVAFDRYGKGIHAKARLNLADCAAYALSKTMNSPCCSRATTSGQPTCGHVFELTPCPLSESGKEGRAMGKTMDNPVSPKTGAQMQRGMSSMTLEYKGARTTFDMPGWYCDASDESIHTGEDMKVSDRALNVLKAAKELK